MTWGWRKILQIRPLIREFVWHKVSNGNNVSIWYDNWCSLSPLAATVSTRHMYRAGLTTSSKVSEVLQHGVVMWPHELFDFYPFLASITSPTSIGARDCLEWRDNMGNVKSFAVNVVWQALRPRDVKKLKTQDLLRSWDVTGALAANCPLCESTPDSHAHIFFECPFSRHIWNRVKDWAGLSGLPPSIDLIISDITPGAHRRTTKCVIAKLVVAAAAYFLWQERNA
ncbi:hypothetical protein Tco_0320412 [Tanacetum coccineum]